MKDIVRTVKLNDLILLYIAVWITAGVVLRFGAPWAW